MKNGDQPAAPTLVYNESTGERNGHRQGLTKREMIAAMALQGVLGNIGFYENAISAVQNGTAKSFESNLTGMAVEFADELLKQLEQK